MLEFLSLRDGGEAAELPAVTLEAFSGQSNGHRVRCGLGCFRPDKPLDPALVEAALNRFPGVYQKTVDPRAPIWAQRHGAARG